MGDLTKLGFTKGCWAVYSLRKEQAYLHKEGGTLAFWTLDFLGFCHMTLF